MRRRSTIAIVMTAALAVAMASFSAVASSSQEESFVSRINAERSARGLRAVSVSSDLVAIARDWSAEMASDGAISHDPNLPNEVSNWSQLGDNVGRGPNVSTIHAAFMDSSTHRSIILEPAFTHVGVGVVQSGDTLYVTEVFVRRVAKTTTVRRTTQRRTVSRPRAPAPVARPADSIVGLTGVMWEIHLGPRPVTVDVLEELVSLDAPGGAPGR